jgi:hypothetical protein
MDILTGRQMNRQKDGWTGRQMKTQIDKLIGLKQIKWGDRQSDGRMDRWTFLQADR